MARRARPFQLRPPRPYQAVPWHVDKDAHVSIAGVLCRYIRSDKDGYIFQSIAAPTLHFALTLKEHEALAARLAKKD
ncbi:hypothetical protein [Bradyrhizobium sp. WSM471]|uniref:hypothetical protein n=1 Tax=Bradyrhizobium sp. WSM471 TaxID=319017 RepID=UPI00024D2AA4|nr:MULTISPECIES: hypothetical protein [Bradyrhizobium]EHR03029.1 hypothetical protein Bra471DRAFT_03795 [Bradyrhizobium sp. WSM471]UFW38273.1 hypothetical protein BcanWSM471_18635 [Bradyrhizobium canariense]